MNIQDFISLAEEYAQLIETIDTHELDDFLRECARLLPLIYSNALVLPEPSELDEETIGIGKAAFTGSIEKIETKLGTYDLYYECFDPRVDADHVTQLISDDLYDIYRDLKTGLLLYEMGTEAGRNEALWSWRFSLESHFGDHLVDVMRPIHRLVMAGRKIC